MVPQDILQGRLTMATRIDAFFQQLGQRGHEPGLRSRTAIVRFEVSSGSGADHWSVAIDKGDIAVSQSAADTADCVIKVDEALLAKIAQGETNAMAAMLRGALLADGDTELLVMTRRLLTSEAKS
jgi:putative sterol carrier protein